MNGSDATVLEPEGMDDERLAMLRGDDPAAMFEKKAVALSTTILAIRVTNDAEYVALGEHRKRARELKDQMDTFFDGLWRPVKEAAESIRERWKTSVAVVEAGIRASDEEILRYDQEQKAARDALLAEENERLRNEAIAKKAKEVADLMEQGRTDEAYEVDKIEPVVAPVSSDRVPDLPKVKGQAVRESWSAEVIDFAALVREVAAGRQPLTFLTASLTALNNAVRSSKQHTRIPGVRPVVRKYVSS